MALDPYAPCPCGSGKKFKWCCQPIHVEIDRAFQQYAEGQHEAALGIMHQVVEQNPANPEAWGRRAQLLYDSGKTDEAEASLQKALDINPKYPFGHLLRGLFRKAEGEIAGALLLFRKAADLYDPDARDVLAQVYSLIADAEQRLHRPLAVQAALRIAGRIRPDEEIDKALTTAFGEQSGLPASARRDYSLMPLPASASVQQRDAWNAALSQATTGKLTDAAKALEQLAGEMSQEPAACYNLGLVRAWLGQNPAAIEALDRYLSLESNEDRAAAAWSLAEVLRFGQGMEDQSDYVERSVVFRIRDPERFFDFINSGQQEGLLYGVQLDQEHGVLSGIVLERGGLIAGGMSTQFPKLGAYFLVIGDVFRLWNINSDALDRARQFVQERAGATLAEAQTRRGPANFGDVLAEALVFPIGISDRDLAHQKIREQVQNYFEEKWIHKPLRSLNLTPPIDAAGHAVLRRKLKGVVQFLEESLAKIETGYDFSRLRRKLGLSADGATVEPSKDGHETLDIDRMGAAELASLPVEGLSDEQIEEAYRAAQKLDAHELACRFAKALVVRPPRVDRPDRSPWYGYLIQRSLLDGDIDTALQFVDEGEKADCEQNEGRRRNDYELRRGQVHAKRGEVDRARDIFERLIERAPSDLQYQSTAAESMLSLKHGAAALQFAENGLAQARQQKDRDSEEHFMELVAAARKQAGK
jgi:tetratricopeptide (TPR) repeat protein